MSLKDNSKAHAPVMEDAPPLMTARQRGRVAVGRLLRVTVLFVVHNTAVRGCRRARCNRVHAAQDIWPQGRKD